MAILLTVGCTREDVLAYFPDLSEDDAAVVADTINQLQAQNAQLEAIVAADSHYGRHVLTNDGLDRLAACESYTSGHYTAVSASGTYRGAYQFRQTTWNWVIEETGIATWLHGVDPAAASALEQDAMAELLFQVGGPGHWECAPCISSLNASGCPSRARSAYEMMLANGHHH
jgi:hypothetical protein